ncbi:FKBP-type peptidyl-prolyl cis-trans isomerase [Candidatus Gracilibacteria bacterium]|nr:FKBP-type peptidyl-prolyl cis-trans isomerase [Candidatus Gracilibacteria bacterium]
MRIIIILCISVLIGSGTLFAEESGSLALNPGKEELVQKTVENVMHKGEEYRIEMIQQIQRQQTKNSTKNESLDRLLYVLKEKGKISNDKVVAPQKKVTKSKNNTLAKKKMLIKKPKKKMINTNKEVYISKGSLVTLNYTLRENNKDGKILETTIKEIAERDNTYNTEKAYRPFSVLVGYGNIILGFEKGLMGMKQGEKKNIVVTPEEGYGSGGKIQEIKKNAIAPVFIIKNDIRDYADTIEETIEKTQLNDEIKNIKTGQIYTGANGAGAKVIRITEKDITFQIDNIENPFFKRNMTIGSTAEKGNAVFKVLNIQNDKVTLEVTNKSSLFYNKKFEVGESINLPKGGKIQIIKIQDDIVTISNKHAMANKTLFFEVEILSIK